MKLLKRSPGVVSELLRQGLNRHQVRLQRQLLRKLEASFNAWKASEGITFSEDRGVFSEDSWPAAEHLCTFLLRTLTEAHTHLQGMRRDHSEFAHYVSKMLDDGKRRQIILDYARRLGATSKELSGDAQAFSRWFGVDAVTDRFRRVHGQAELEIRFVLERLGALARHYIENLPADQRPPTWQRLALEKAVPLFMEDAADPRVRVAAFHCLSIVIQALPSKSQGHVLSKGTFQLVMRVAQKKDEDVWIQCAALELLQTLSPHSLNAVLGRRFQYPGAGDDIFVRRRAATLIARYSRQSDVEELLQAVLDDQSPFVRQGLAMAIPHLKDDLVAGVLPRLAQEDPTPQVRGAAIVATLDLLGHPTLHTSILELLGQVLAREADEFVLRVAMHTATDGALRLRREAPNLVSRWCETLERQLDELHVSATSLVTRRRAAQAREKLWCLRTPPAAQLRDRLAGVLVGLPSGRSRRISPSLFDDCTDTDTGRVLAVMAQDDFGLEIRRGWLGTRIFRDDTFRLRLWRVLYELRRPSPDKRQGFPHTIGRVRFGDLRAPSVLLAELAETKVPGEPLFMEEEGGWRPYLPLVDDALSSLNRFGKKNPVSVFSSEGITELHPPASLWRRLRAHLTLSFRFAHYARLRNWTKASGRRPESYLQALSDLGFTLRLQAYGSDQGDGGRVDPAVSRFFPALTPVALSLPSISQIWERFTAYFPSVYENTIFQLAVFMILLSLFVVGKHLYLTVAIRRARNAIPWSFGGWGTRGKSGTERLKAGLVHALGYGFVAKTTGCEAMFIYGQPFGKAREMFLFRPYDKATIWEQASLLRLAERLAASCFLWECMALSPRYVRILQNDWMQDELATITNTYPDHEDIQGPAGVNLPRVMGEFVPRHGTLFTTEDQMLPILAEEARARETTLIDVGWMKAGLLTSDVLARFPHQEHPSNVSLVLTLAGELGIQEDFALKAMADHVIPDLGVLKTYPPATMRSRSLEFSNGMSANERYGCLSNWRRLKLADHDLETQPNIWITTVVNNRADRVPRSQVFAHILVADISADRHYLIGANLEGLHGYIQAAWDRHESTLTLFPAGAENGPEDVLADLARRARMPTSHELVRARLRIMLEPEVTADELESLLRLSGNPKALHESLPELVRTRLGTAVLAQLETDLAAVEKYRGLLERLSNGETDDLDRELRALMREWFFTKLVILEDYHMSGDRIIERICDDTPPHFYNRIVGLQNIKGTGLDFAYRWQAWDACYSAGQRLLSDNDTTAKAGLQELAAFQDYGLVCEEFVRDTVEKAKRKRFAQAEGAQAELDAILDKMERQVSGLRDGEQSSVGNHSVVGRFLPVLESLLDAKDAVRRRKRANQLYADLISERISLERASLELRKLTKRQKGGWLVRRWESLKAPFSSQIVAFPRRRPAVSLPDRESARPGQEPRTDSDETVRHDGEAA